MQVSENWTKKLQEKTGHSSHEIDILGVTSCVGIALRCVDNDRNKRPCINDIVDELNQLEAKLKAMSLASDVSKDLTVQQLTNKTGGFIAFNIEINPNKYSVRPSQGTMPPCSRRYVVVTLSAQEVAPQYMRCEDMLLVQSTGVSQDLGEINYQELFKTAMANQVVDEVKLPIAYVTLDQ